MEVLNMDFAEELLKLNEEELFGKQKSIDIEERDVMKNLGLLANMILEAYDNDYTEATYYIVSILQKTIVPLLEYFL